MDRYSKDEFVGFCKQSYSYAEVLGKMGLSVSGNNYRKLKNRIKKYNVDTSHFTGQKWHNSPNIDKTTYVGTRETWSLEQVFCKDSKVTQKVLRGYVKRHNVIPYKCAKCDNDGHWNGEELPLELDHIDGDDHNNTPSNLRYLCPNCHAQTKTFRGKNKALKLRNSSSKINTPAV